MSSRQRNPYEECEVLAMCERLFRRGMESDSTERARGELVQATVDIAIAKLCDEAETPFAVSYYRSEDCRSESMLKALMALEKARTDTAHAMVAYIIKAVQNNARNLMDTHVRRARRCVSETDFGSVSESDNMVALRENRIFITK